jgi:hypothetical protein
LLPAPVRVHGHQPVGHRTAAAEGDAQVVDWIRREVGGGIVTFVRDAQHPVAKSGRVGVGFHVVRRAALSNAPEQQKLNRRGRRGHAEIAENLGVMGPASQNILLEAWTRVGLANRRLTR